MGRLQMTVDSWMAGKPAMALLPRSTAYKFRRVLLQAVGIDIATPFDVTALAVRVRTLEMVKIPDHQYPAAA